MTDWALQSDTNYFRPFNNILIGQTTNIATFSTVFQKLNNSVCSDLVCVNPGPAVLDRRFAAYTGISDAATFASGDNCTNWTTTANHGFVGFTTGVSGSGYEGPFRGQSYTCAGSYALYCVEQP